MKSSEKLEQDVKILKYAENTWNKEVIRKILQHIKHSMEVDSLLEEEQKLKIRTMNRTGKRGYYFGKSKEWTTK